MTPISWQRRVGSARTPQEVVGIARDFVTTFSPYEIHAVPEPCRPPAKLFLEDIPQLAFELVRHQCASAENEEIVQRLAHFFSQAAARIAQLAAHGQDRTAA